MRVPPLLAASALLFAGVTVFAVSFVVEHRRSRGRRPLPVPDVADVPYQPRRDYPTVTAGAPAAVALGPGRDWGILRVAVSGPHGLWLGDAQVRASSAGDDDQEDADEVEVGRSPFQPGTFAVAVPAGRYQVRVTAPGMRGATIGDVATDGEVVQVRLQREPILVGAVGTLGDPGCDGLEVTLAEPDQGGEEGAPRLGDTELGDIELDADHCTFVAGDLPEGPFWVVARRRHQEAQVWITVPEQGDPAAVCLAPPCTATPAAVVALVADVRRQRIDDALVAWTIDVNDGSRTVKINSRSPLPVYGAPAGQTATVEALRGDHSDRMVVTLSAGVTDLMLTLPVVDDGRAGALRDVSSGLVSRR